MLQKRLRALTKQSAKAGRTTSLQGQTLELALVIVSLLLLPAMDRSVQAQLLLSCLSILLNNNNKKGSSEGTKSELRVADEVIAQVIVRTERKILAMGR